MASVLAHECCEAYLDRFCNFWADGPEISQGSEYALEVCDPCEDISYVVKVGEQSVSVSDFIFPSWCNVNSKALNICLLIIAINSRHHSPLQAVDIL